MWLLATDTLELKLFGDVDDKQTPEYAILSHRWEDEEVSYREMCIKGPDVEKKKGFIKIQGFCQQARKDHFEYAWVDTCWLVTSARSSGSSSKLFSIDKTSSAELSEAINSMFRWYQKSAICYVYLFDVPWFPGSYTDECMKFLPHSQWFRRGWTLQELLAPVRLSFFSDDWKFLGTKLQFLELLNRITGIEIDALSNKPLGEFNVAQRMSWAARRQTTRVEDVAYSLLGIFEVNMPLLYGEGEKAFIRLQECILASQEDYTIFAWDASLEDKPHPEDRVSWDNWLGGPVPMHVREALHPLLASSPRFFIHRVGTPHQWDYSHLTKLPDMSKADSPASRHEQQPLTVTPRGISLESPCLTRGGRTLLTIGITMVISYLVNQDGWLCLSLHQPPDSQVGQSLGPLFRCSGLRFFARPLVFEYRKIYGARYAMPKRYDDDKHPRGFLGIEFGKAISRSFSHYSAINLAEKIQQRPWFQEWRNVSMVPSSFIEGESLLWDPQESPFAKQTPLLLNNFDRTLWRLGQGLTNLFWPKRSSCRSSLALMICCAVALSTAREKRALRKPIDLHRAEHELEMYIWHEAPERLERLFDSLDMGRNAHCIATRIPVESNDSGEQLIRIEFVAELLRCCKILAGTSTKEEKLWLMVTEERFVASCSCMVTSSSHSESSLTLPEHACQGLATIEEVIHEMKSRFESRPSQKCVAACLAWLKGEMEKWLDYMLDFELKVMFETMASICDASGQTSSRLYTTTRLLAAWNNALRGDLTDSDLESPIIRAIHQMATADGPVSERD